MIETLRLLLADDERRLSGLEEVVAFRSLMDQLEAQWLSSLHEVVVSGEADAAGMAITDCLSEYTRIPEPLGPMLGVGSTLLAGWPPLRLLVSTSLRVDCR